MKLIQTTDYLLLIDEEAEIRIGDYFLNPNFTLRECDNLNMTKYGNIQDKHKHSWKLSMCKGKVIAYYPLLKEAKELNLPLLPKFKKDEVDVEKILNNFPYSDFTFREKSGFKVGYMLAQSKQFSLEDVKEAFLQGCYSMSDYIDGNNKSEDYDIYEESDLYIQSLSTQQLPKEFIPEYKNKCWCSKPMSGGCFECIEILKTITNSEGKEELVGKYTY